MASEQIPFRLKPLENTAANLRFGFYPAELKWMIGILHRFPAIESALIFGSRSMGTYREHADVDLAIQGKGVDRQTVLRLKTTLEEAFFPLSFDVIHYDTLDHSGLLEHIDRWGVDLLRLSLEDPISPNKNF